MKRLAKLIILLAVLLCLSSCTTLRIKMGENSRFTLLPPSAIDEPMDSYQLITGSFPGYENVAMEAWFTCDESELAELMKHREFSIKVNLGEGNGACTIWTGDFTYEYVKINADYHT